LTLRLGANESLMSEKRYQVFVSSTYLDLEEERRRVVEALLQIECIPVGMELFPAVDEEQWKFIEHIIDDCDYYILIIAGRYGSLTPEGVSFTEKEFDYVLGKNIPVLAFLHADPGAIKANKRELDKNAVERLEAFQQRVRTGRVVKTWSTPSELAGQVVISLTRALTSHPMRGWIRGGGPSSVTLLQELNELRKRNQELEESIGQHQARARAASSNLAAGSELVILHGKLSSQHQTKERSWSDTVTWNRVLSIIGPSMLTQWQPETLIGERLARECSRYKFASAQDPSISESSLDTVKVQFLALGLIDVKSFQNRAGLMAPFWILTSTGQAELLAVKSIRKATLEVPAQDEANTREKVPNQGSQADG